MKKRWNRTGKMTMYSLMAMMVMAGAGFEMTASAEDIIDSDEIPAVQEIVPESENSDALPAESPEADAAGEEGLEVVQVVMIEDEQVPGAAAPEMAGEDAESEAEEDVKISEDTEAGEDAETPENAEVPEDAEAEAGKDAETPENAEVPEDAEAEAGEDAETPENADAPENMEAEAPEEESGTCVSGTITYENGEVAVTVVASEAAQLPADTIVKVTRLEEGSAEYEAAKEAARQSVGTDENASYTFYDVTLESEGETLDVEDGTVSVKMEFKAAAARREVVSIEETGSGKIARNVTDRTEAGRTGTVVLPY